MFSINIYLRFALMAVLIIGGVTLAFAVSFWYALPLILIGLVLLAGYFLLGTVQSSAVFVQNQDMDGAEKRMALTIKPEWLYKPNKSVFYMLKGTIAAQRQDFETAEMHYMQAQKVGFTTDNEKAIVLLSIANFRAQKNNWVGAENYMRQLRELKITEPMIKEQMATMEKAMKQRGQVNAQLRQGFRGFTPGGKRSRPKMR